MQEEARKDIRLEKATAIFAAFALGMFITMYFMNVPWTPNAPNPLVLTPIIAIMFTMGLSGCKGERVRISVISVVSFLIGGALTYTLFGMLI